MVGMNKIHGQRRMIQAAFRSTDVDQSVFRRVQDVMHQAFSQTGCVPAVSLVAEEVGSSWGAVNRCYWMIMDNLPEKHAVEAAYVQFLEEACVTQKQVPSRKLLEFAATARLTAERIGAAINIDPARVRQQAKDFGIQLSIVEAPGLALPRRLIAAAMRSICRTGVNVATAARVAGVTSATIEDRLNQFEMVLPGYKVPKPKKKRPRRRPKSDLLTIIKHIKSFRSLEEVVIATAQALLRSDGQDPDILVPGAYEDEDGMLCSDAIQMVDGQPIGFIYAYRREATRVQQVLDALLAAGEAPGLGDPIALAA